MYGRADPPSDAPAAREPTDAHLVRLARDGDPRAYEAIVARYREPLRRSCARITPERAEDAVQQALLSAWLALERGAEVRELRPWLYSIARNAAIDQARGVRTELVELGPEVPGGEDPAHAEARRREVTEVLEAVAALPERQRRALVATALHGRPTEAVAVDLGLSGGALRQLVHRARTTVRAAVPSVGFPIPAWLAEFLGEEGLRRGAVLLSSGSGAAILAKTTATVATVGAVAIGGVAVDRSALRERSPSGQAASAAPASTSEGADRGAPAGAALIDGATLLAARRAEGSARPSPEPERAEPGRPSGGDAGDEPGRERHDRGGEDPVALDAPETFRASEARQRRRDAATGGGGDHGREHDDWLAPTRENAQAADGDGDGAGDHRRRHRSERTPTGAGEPTDEGEPTGAERPTRPTSTTAAAAPSSPAQPALPEATATPAPTGSGSAAPAEHDGASSERVADLAAPRDISPEAASSE